MLTTPAQAVRTDGVFVAQRLVDDAGVRELIKACEPLLTNQESRRPGVRRVLQRAPSVITALREAGIGTLLIDLLGPAARIIRAVLFDKTPTTNWLVPWHQDATIAVTERLDVPGFGPWAIKDGEHHCQPPLDIMEQIVTIRIHLDACGPLDGPMRVIPRSHTQGLLDDGAMASLVSTTEAVECCTPAGGGVITTPLAVHSSPKAASPTRRRVLHLDCTSMSLPGGLRWAEQVRL